MCCEAMNRRERQRGSKEREAERGRKKGNGEIEVRWKGGEEKKLKEWGCEAAEPKSTSAGQRERCEERKKEKKGRS